jgi:hypothetical protein
MKHGMELAVQMENGGMEWNFAVMSGRVDAALSVRLIESVQWFSSH